MVGSFMYAQHGRTLGGESPLPARPEELLAKGNCVVR